MCRDQQHSTCIVLKTPFAIIRFQEPVDHARAAKDLMTRSILTYAIHELWGEGIDYASLHADIRRRTEARWDDYRYVSFRFELDSFQGSRSSREQKATMEALAFMDFQGKIVMKNPDHLFTIFEDFKLKAPAPHRVFLGRLVAESNRKVVAKYNLKKRKYIATTSMDAELSLVTANMARAGPGKSAYDPFMGTGSFPLACAEFGSAVFGSDMDGRSIRGKKDRNVKSNFKQYGTSPLYLGGFAADITNTPLRETRCLDSIVCDPPYGVREGLKVLGSNRDYLQEEIFLADGRPAHLVEGYIPPRKPYSFLRMLDDILDFSANMLVDDGRLCMWMPVAGAVEEAIDEDNVQVTEQETEYDVPQHPMLKLVSTCTQDFNKWSRRLLTYQRLQDSSVDADSLIAYRTQRLELQGVNGDGSADELNAFRRKYFQGFKD
ncbi:related to TRM11 Catalytic subunit of an adoMet-dependent tRNA methyltransferase complex (Trm11p-Trm112p) [Ramularia collo-cygni]|uniref:tRNA (guanine(10)-N(2))-methyltransferase n=1 Tax=Ramularia collo-cygni TaxID=112498 RepID=A0A2D3V9H5_9PEZI|nr:related to TRM11 Catalytic subunit of an adoMet-dependent tRNA methyltransferase complex (Trm11p-Trm112p) [Ramularia collo-cygni]CZT24673.1 related to TRM11 Catalytic subunit of an adoMet-dependent tRNA methyltransferase complex (Trm11p-Trm112p) [Ramularia collo-cygni]